MVESVYGVFFTVIGPQVEVCTDLHQLGEQFDDILPKVCDSYQARTARTSFTGGRSRVRGCKPSLELENVEIEVLVGRTADGTSKIFSERFQRC